MSLRLMRLSAQEVKCWPCALSCQILKFQPPLWLREYCFIQCLPCAPRRQAWMGTWYQCLRTAFADVVSEFLSSLPPTWVR